MKGKIYEHVNCERISDLFGSAETLDTLVTNVENQCNCDDHTPDEFLPLLSKVIVQTQHRNFAEIVELIELFMSSNDKDLREKLLRNKRLQKIIVLSYVNHAKQQIEYDQNNAQIILMNGINIVQGTKVERILQNELIRLNHILMDHQAKDLESAESYGDELISKFNQVTQQLKGNLQTWTQYVVLFLLKVTRFFIRIFPSDRQLYDSLRKLGHAKTNSSKKSYNCVTSDVSGSFLNSQLYLTINYNRQNSKHRNNNQRIATSNEVRNEAKEGGDEPQWCCFPFSCFISILSEFRELQRGKGKGE